MPEEKVEVEAKGEADVHMTMCKTSNMKSTIKGCLSWQQSNLLICLSPSLSRICCFVGFLLLLFCLFDCF